MADETTNKGPLPAGDPNSALPGDITESIALGGFCAVSGQPSSLSNLAYSNAIGNNNLTQQNTLANQQAMNQIAQAVLGNVVGLVADLSPMEAVAVVKLDTGNDVAQQLVDLQAAVNSGATPTPAPWPPRPPKPTTPQVRKNPGGKGLIVSPTQFPVSLTVDDIINGHQVSNVNGVPTVTANSDQYPVYVTNGLSAGPAPTPNTISNISRAIFPVQVKLGTGTGQATVTEGPQGATLTVNPDMFPVEVRITP